MASVRYIEIKEKADELLEQHAQGHFPVPVIEIAQALDISVFADSNYNSNRSGHIEIDDNGKLAIIINNAHSPVRKRFTIAHEIAHTIFDMDYIEKHGYADRNGNASDATYRKREQIANNFAANLLMPEDTFISQWLALGTLDKVADYFSVSKDSAKFRAMNLGLISS